LYVDYETLERAFHSVRGTADPLLKVWLTLKHMGLTPAKPCRVTSGEPAISSYDRLFGGVRADNLCVVPFSHRQSDLTSKEAREAARSQIQTNVKKFADGTVSSADPRSFLRFRQLEDQSWEVRAARNYPRGLGHGRNGFAVSDDTRVSLPIAAFAIWYGRVADIPDDVEPREWLVETMLSELHIDEAERAAIFVEDAIPVTTRTTRLSLDELNSICEGEPPAELVVEPPRTEDEAAYFKRMRAAVPDLDRPLWLREDPETLFKRVLGAGYKALLIYGPPRTGKSRIIDNVIPRTDARRATIQIHDGWGYDYLVEGLRNVNGSWVWQDGPLKAALTAGRRYIVLEEINRTSFSQALGEVFSLIEPAYRGEQCGIRLRSGATLSIPEDTVFIFTMNTLDRSTEEVDDALLGRVAAIEYAPRADALATILRGKDLGEPVREGLMRLFAEVQEYYALGHGYFADLPHKASSGAAIDHYLTRIRPVLQNALGPRSDKLAHIDNVAGDLLGGE
jgi:5-methylcytosine-specific restriction protein B